MTPYLKIDHVDKTFNRGARETEVLKDITLGVDAGRVRLDHRPLRLRQVHAAQHRRRPHSGDARRGAAREPGGQRAGPRPRRGVPEPLAAAVAHRLRERAARGRQGVLAGKRSRAERDAVDHAQSRTGPDGARQGQAAGGDLRRHEAARRHRPRARHGAQGAAARRAVRRARCADPRAPAGRGDGDPRTSSATRC